GRKQAVRARDPTMVATRRLVLAALKDRDIASRSQDSREGIGEDEILALLAKMIRQREESAAAFEAGGRPELAAAERGEIAIIRGYQPAQMSEAETRAAVAAAIEETGEKSARDLGQVMALLKAPYSGRMDLGGAS